MAQPEENGRASVDEGTDVVTLDEVTMEIGNVDFHNRSGMISGNVYRGGTLRGDGDITIEGQVLGMPDTRCAIEAGGVVQIEQSVASAKVSGHRVVIMGGVEDCQIQSDAPVEIHGDLTGSRVVVGAYTEEIRALNRMRLEMRSVEQKISELRVQTGSAARRFMRDYPQVNLSMGNILIPRNRDLQVDLSQFYSALDTEDPERVDRGLDEFYMRVVVGMLTRNNSHYISQNPSRHKVFLKLIEDLRQHMLRIRELDKLSCQVGEMAEKGAKRKEKIESPDRAASLRVGGHVGEGVVVTLIHIKGLQEASDGALSADRISREARVVAGEEGEGLALACVGESGEKVLSAAPGGEFADGLFVIENGQVVWQANA